MENEFSYRKDLRNDILADENSQVVEQKLSKMNKEDIKAIISSVGRLAQNTSTIDLMVKYGADVNAVTDEFGNTALMNLLSPLHKGNQIYWAKPEIIEAFIKHGADVNAKTSNGISVFDYAKKSDKPEIIAVIEKYLSSSKK